MMERIKIATATDWISFFSLAAAENWRVSSVERQLFQGVWADCAQTLDVAGVFAGLVTAVPHQRSGWIGNLIVPPSSRGRGHGRQLFTEALHGLKERGMESCWLTASEQGRPLYESFDFVVIDQVERWVRRKRVGEKKIPTATSLLATEALTAADREAWGEERTLLLTELTAEGLSLCDQNSVLCLQNGGDFQVLGPWYSFDLCPRTNRQLLAQALAAADPEREVVVDLLVSSPLKELLGETGFVPMGKSALMVQGDKAAAQLNTIISLASLGSIG